MPAPPRRVTPSFAIVFLALAVLVFPTSSRAQPPPPSEAVATCVATVGGECYVAGSFSLDAVSQGADYFRVCRSQDTDGWGGCNTVIAHNAQMPFAVSADDLPSDGMRRAYYVSACDAQGKCTRWSDNDEAYVWMDSSKPSVPTASVSSSVWKVDRTALYEIEITATDATSGVGEIRVVINLYGSNSANRRGFFSWRHDDLDYAFEKDRIPCDGGGWASMHGTLHGPTRTTLLGCDTSLLSGGERRVTFTVRPNETFGVFGPVNDVAARAWDHLGNRSSWTQFNLNFSTVRPFDAPGKLIGYQGILSADGLAVAEQEGIGVNLATLILQRRTCAPFYWRSVDSEQILGDFANRGVRAMVVLENFLFKNVNDSAGYYDDCDDPALPPPLEPTTCKNGALWRRLPDWRTRLDTFDELHGSGVTSDSVAFFLIASEVNDRCFDLEEVEEVAQEIKSRYPNVSAGFIYGATYFRDGTRLSEPPPPYFPAIFDVVGLFSYDNFNVNDPLEQRNATDLYYNPEDPGDLSTVYGDLLSKLHRHQEVFLVFDADYSGGPDPCVDPNGEPKTGNAAQGWCPDDLADVADNYAEFMTFRPEVTMLGGFTWQSLLDLPQSVRERAAEMVCYAFDNHSWFCN